MPETPADLAVFLTRARKRKGWSVVKLATISDVPYDTTERACRTGRCSSQTFLHLSSALQIRLELPHTPILTAQEAQRG